MADVFVNNFGLDTVFELMGDEGMAQVIDFGVFEAGLFEIPVNTGPDVSDQKRAAGFGDKEVGIIHFGTKAEIVIDSGDGRTIQEYVPGGIIFQGLDVKFGFFDIFKVEIGQLGDTDSGLEEKFDDGTDSDVQEGGVAQSADFSRGEEAGGQSLVFGVGKRVGGVLGYKLLIVEEFEEGF